MATHDYVIDNSTGANVRADLNLVLQAILSNNSSSSAPSTTAAYMFWADTTTGTLKIRNSSDNAWVELLQLDGTLTLEDGTATNPALAFRDDLNTGIFSSGANVLDIATGGVSRVQIDTSEITFNESGEDTDFRIEGDNNGNLFFVDASTDRIGIGTNSPQHDLDILKTSSGADSSFRVGSTAASGDNDATIVINNGGSGDASLRFDYESIASRCKIYVNSSTNDLIFDTDGNETMRLKSDHTVGIGTTSTSAKLDILNNANSLALVVKSGLNSNQTSSVELRNDTGAGKLFQGVFGSAASTFGNITASDAFISSQTNLCVNSSNASGLIKFGIGNPVAEKMRLDSSGRLSIGTTDVPGAGVQMDLRKSADTTVYSATANQPNGLSIFNPSGVDGGFSGIQIGSTSSSGHFGSTVLKNVSVTTGYSSDFVVQTRHQGNYGERLRVRSEGGLCFNGDTAAANALDSYEEGNWTPSVSAGAISGTSITYTGRYTKIGRMVQLFFNAANTAGDIQISSYVIFSGLPYAAGSSVYGTGRIMTEDGEVASRQGDWVAGGSSILINAAGSSSGTVRLSGSLTYHTD
tara:strand:- start:53 stop:1792 length:1740 start_codon:yes stop_codon:yes gene_type:complete